MHERSIRQINPFDCQVIRFGKMLHDFRSLYTKCRVIRVYCFSCIEIYCEFVILFSGKLQDGVISYSVLV